MARSKCRFYLNLYRMERDLLEIFITKHFKINILFVNKNQHHLDVWKEMSFYSKQNNSQHIGMKNTRILK